VSTTLTRRTNQIRLRQFERIVARAINTLPPQVVAKLDNIEIVVEGEPTASQQSDPTETLFGLYEGVPLTERDGGYSLVPPDKITIFRGPLEREYVDRAELLRQIRMTVLHELAHHFGIDDDRLDELGLA